MRIRFSAGYFYNPGYQSLMKDLKQSTKQRFGALDFNIQHTMSKPKSLRMRAK